MRTAILTARRAVTPHTHDAEAEALCSHLADVGGGGQTVCAYVPITFEPGSIALLDTLLRLGTRVLLPVARADADGTPQPMQWGPYEPGRLVPAPFGLREPQEPWLPADAVADATAVLVPALAVDRARGATGARRGVLRPDVAVGRPGGTAYRGGPRRRTGRRGPGRSPRRRDDPRAHAAPRTRRAGVIQQRASASFIARFSFLDTHSP